MLMVSVYLLPTCETHKARLIVLKQNHSYQDIGQSHTLGDYINANLQAQWSYANPCLAIVYMTLTLSWKKTYWIQP